MEKILIIDDSLVQASQLQSILADSYDITISQTAEDGLRRVRTETFSLILLDVVMPGMDGFTLLKKLQEEIITQSIPVILITSLSDIEDEQYGLTLGAVDYITKPFSIGALQRKIRAMFAMLEHHKPPRDIYDDGRLFLDFSEQAATLNGKPLTLSSMEYKMLFLFCKNPRQVLTRQRLLERLWDVDEKFVDEHTLTTSISRIRGKIEADGDAYIKTIYGIGYQWTGGERK